MVKNIFPAILHETVAGLCENSPTAQSSDDTLLAKPMQTLQQDNREFCLLQLQTDTYTTLLLTTYYTKGGYIKYDCWIFIIITAGFLQK